MSAPRIITNPYTGSLYDFDSIPDTGRGKACPVTGMPLDAKALEYWDDSNMQHPEARTAARKAAEEAVAKVTAQLTP